MYKILHIPSGSYLLNQFKNPLLFSELIYAYEVLHDGYWTDWDKQANPRVDFDDIIYNEFEIIKVD